MVCPISSDVSLFRPNPLIVDDIDSGPDGDFEYQDHRSKPSPKGVKRLRMRSRTTICEKTRLIMARCFAENLPSVQIARILHLSPSCVEKRRIRHDTEQSLPTSPRSSHVLIITPGFVDEIESLCEHLHFPTAAEIVKFLSQEHQCSVSTCRTALKKC